MVLLPLRIVYGVMYSGVGIYEGFGVWGGGKVGWEVFTAGMMDEDKY